MSYNLLVLFGFGIVFCLLFAFSGLIHYIVCEYQARKYHKRIMDKVTLCHKMKGLK